MVGRGEGKWGMTSNEYRVSLWGEEDVLELYSNVVCTAM